MVKTVFICFIHGFKGDEETFFQFPEHLRKLVADQKPDLKVHTALYPKYDTRGDLALCVEAFKEWLQGQITDLETHAATPLAIQNPSVSVILIAHSVGGFVAADTLFSVLDNRPTSSDPNIRLMFPLIQGLIAFDTPYNGLSRSMFAYGAFSQYQNISSIWNVGSSVGTLLAGSGARSVAAGQLASQSSSLSTGSTNWKRWQLLAARTGTYGAIVAGGVAAYVNRKEIAESLSNVNKQSISSAWSKVNYDNISGGLSAVPAYVSRDSIGEGFAWMASHLKFVGALMKPAQLKTRLERLGQLKGIGVANFYTSLGENGYWTGGYFVPKRTFCAIPKEPPEEARIFREQPNVDAGDEIAAHCTMFRPDKNVRYEEMVEKARDLVVEYLKNDPRAIMDEFEPSHAQRQRTMSEAKLWDDDGKMLGHKEEEKGDDDQSQLEAILNKSSMPEPTDGGISDEELQKAADLPLPAEDVDEADMKKLLDGDGEKDAWKNWRSRLATPFTRLQMPAMPTMPSMSMPSMPSMPSMTMPSIPSMRIPGKAKEGVVDVAADDALKRKSEKAFSEEESTKGESIQEKAALVPIPDGDSTKGEDTQKKADDQKTNTTVPEEKGEKAAEVEKAEPKSEKMDNVDKAPQERKQSDPDEVLKGWALPPGDELRRAGDMEMEKPDGIEADEIPKAGKVATEAPLPIDS